MDLHLSYAQADALLTVLAEAKSRPDQDVLLRPLYEQTARWLEAVDDRRAPRPPQPAAF